MEPMNPVVHFEMPYEDKNRAAAFYQKAFGWKSTMYGPEMGNYVVVHTTEVENGTNMPKTAGTINGGLFEKTTENSHPSVVIAVENIQAAMEKVKRAGGQILGGQTPGEPDDIPGVGRYCAFIDTEGNRGGILEPKGM